MNEYWIQDLWVNLYILKSEGPSEMHSRILRELADVVVKPLSIIFEKHGSRVKSPVAGEKENIAPMFYKSRKKDPGN